LRTGAASLALAAALVLLAGPARADSQKVGPEGTVHRLTSENWTSGGGRVSGTALRHYRQYDDGTTASSLVPGTDDASADRDPAIEIDPATGQPVLVWSRNEGGGYQVYVSRFDGSAWAFPKPVFVQPGNGKSPDIRIASALIHVMWRQETSATRVSLDRTTLDRVFGPETLPISDAGLVPPDGLPSPNAAASDPPCGDAYFAAEVPPRTSGEGGRIQVWGVRDAPVPVDYAQGFLLPQDVRNVQQPRARWIHDRFVLSFNTAERFFYTIRSSAGWSDLKTILLDASTSVSDARIQMEEMIRRTR
jgi:hypothetical protein